MTTHGSGRRFGVRSVYTLAGEWGTGSHLLALPSIDVSRQSTGLGKTMRLKASKMKRQQDLSLKAWASCMLSFLGLALLICWFSRRLAVAADGRDPGVLSVHLGC